MGLDWGGLCVVLWFWARECTGPRPQREGLGGWVGLGGLGCRLVVVVLFWLFVVVPNLFGTDLSKVWSLSRLLSRVQNESFWFGNFEFGEPQKWSVTGCSSLQPLRCRSKRVDLNSGSCFHFDLRSWYTKVNL